MLSDNIRNYRKENNMSQDELAEKLDVSRQSVSLWENGQTQPTVENVIALAKIFNISANDLLGDEIEKAAVSPTANTGKKKPIWWIFVVAGIAILAVIVCLLVLGNGCAENDPQPPTSATSSTLSATVTTDSQQTTAEPHNSTSDHTATTSASRTATTTLNRTTTKNSAIQTTKKSATTKRRVTTTTKKPKPFDLFTYCKNFAIQIGTLNGDFTIYQKPSTRYGGYENEYFSMSYWGDSDMVEFCLHCPLDDTYSINFYLRMRGGYNGKYEYLSSRYFRDDGTSIRSASGTIDPAVFSEKYPLNCSSYVGSTDKQNSFMEESRVGMCDLIKCLKQFVKVEKMECGFDAFGFVNF